MDILTRSVRIKGTSNPAGAIIQALCDFGTDEAPREPTIDEKRAAIRRVLDELAEQAGWVSLPDSPVGLTKKQAVAQYARALRRADLTDPETVTIPEPPTVTPADFQPAAADTVQDGAAATVQSVPGWASWAEPTANGWYTAHIVDPLAQPLPATISAATNRQILIALIAVMQDMAVMIWAIARMVIAMRNDRWPGLQE